MLSKPVKLRYVILIACGIILLLRFVHYYPEFESRKRQDLSCVSESLSKSDTKGFRCKDLQAINHHYQSQVKPIFAGKCLMCHGIPEKIPLYGALPLIQLLLRYDMDEAKEHLDMSFDFPFEGRGTAVDHLDSIKEVVQENQMPPRVYKIMHWRSALTQGEQKAIFQWIEESRRKLLD